MKSILQGMDDKQKKKSLLSFLKMVKWIESEFVEQLSDILLVEFESCDFEVTLPTEEIFTNLKILIRFVENEQFKVI